MLRDRLFQRLAHPAKSASIARISGSPRNLGCDSLQRKEFENFDFFSEHQANGVFVELNINRTAMFVMLPHLFSVGGLEAFDADVGSCARHAGDAHD